MVACHTLFASPHSTRMPRAQKRPPPFRGGGLVDDSGPVSPGAYSFFFSITGAFCFQTAGFAVTHASGATLCAGWNSK